MAGWSIDNPIETKKFPTKTDQLLNDIIQNCHSYCVRFLSTKGRFFLCFSSFSVSKWKKLAFANKELLHWKFPCKSSFDWLRLVFHFDVHRTMRGTFKRPPWRCCQRLHRPTCCRSRASGRSVSGTRSTWSARCSAARKRNQKRECKLRTEEWKKLLQPDLKHQEWCHL